MNPLLLSPFRESMLSVPGSTGEAEAGKETQASRTLQSEWVRKNMLAQRVEHAPPGKLRTEEKDEEHEPLKR